MIDSGVFNEWNKSFDKLRYKHDTWYIFSDWLDLTVDGFTIPLTKIRGY